MEDYPFEDRSKHWDGKFLYSHHATDPCGGKLVNSFDLVRLHKFADLDDEAQPNTPGNRLPSYTAMLELATSNPDVFRRTDVARIKQFLSLRADRFRAAYGRHVKELPRCCVFFGTTNTKDFLQDTTGNRRFWPVDTGEQAPTKSVWQELPAEVDQIWAEAFFYWKMGETLYLSGEVEDDAKIKQEEHREASPHEGVTLDFINRQVPEDWETYKLDHRRMFWGGGVQGTENLKLIPRDRICAAEVWCEALNGLPKDLNKTIAREINSVIERQMEWCKASKPIRFGPHGLQRGFIKEELH